MSDNIDRIERYLSGEMTAPERASFEADMQADEQLASEVAGLLAIDEALELSIEQDLRNELNSLRADDSKSPGNRQIRTTWAIAASIILLVGAALWIVVSSQINKPREYAASNYVEYSFPSLRQSTGSSSIYSEGVKLVEAENLDGALTWFEAFSGQNPDDLEVKFILADLYKQQGRIEEAKLQLVEIVDHSSILWGEKAEWNYICISVGDYWDDTANGYLDKIRNNPDHSYYKQAVAIYGLLED